MPYDKFLFPLNPVVPMLKRLRQLNPLTPEGAIFLLANTGLLITGLFKGINLINLLTCSMICLVGLNILLAGRQLRGLRAIRLVYDPIFADTPFTLRVELQNCSRKKRTGIVISDPAVDGAARWFVGEIQAGESIELRQELVLPRRGNVLRGPMIGASGFPFGLAVRQAILADRQTMLVLPRVGTLQPGALRRLLSPTNPLPGDDYSSPVRHAAAQTEIHSLREYRPGDSPRWIHWKTSARRDQLFVREYEDIPSEQMTLIVDPWLESDASNRSAHELLETTISLAATIVWEWCRQTGNPFFFAIAGRDAEIVSGATNRDLALRILERLANETGYSNANHDELLGQLAGQRAVCGKILAVGTRSGVLLDRIRDELHAHVTCISVAEEDMADYYMAISQVPEQSWDGRRR